MERAPGGPEQALQYCCFLAFESEQNSYRRANRVPQPLTPSNVSISLTEVRLCACVGGGRLTSASGERSKVSGIFSIIIFHYSHSELLFSSF